MPTLKILIGDKVVEAEIVMHKGALYARVPEEYLASSMPLLTAKLEVQTEAVGLFLHVGDMVRAAQQRFEEFYGELGHNSSRTLASQYQRCRELYDAGKFDLAKEKLSAIRELVRQEMISLELRAMVEQELKENPEKSKKVKMTKEGEHEVFYMIAHFDGARLEAKLFGAEPKEPVGQLMNLPNTFYTTSYPYPPKCPCDCNPASMDEEGSVGYRIVSKKFTYGTLLCWSEEIFYGAETTKLKTSVCSRNDDDPEYKQCERIRYAYFPVGSS
jgi:hypothetical protein